jgi:hypothetical protein
MQVPLDERSVAGSGKDSGALLGQGLIPFQEGSKTQQQLAVATWGCELKVLVLPVFFMKG